MKKAFAVILSMLLICLSFAACGSKTGDETAEPQAEAEHSKVLFTMESGGTFTVELYPEYAPETVANFLSLVEAGEYDGTIFHRVVDGFMAQGGAFLPDGSQRTANSIKGEMSGNGFTQNTLKHERGVISMARIGGMYDSASNQFFICYDKADFLDGEYAAFGKVIDGMEVIDSFLSVQRTYGSDGAISAPVEPIIIEKAEVI